MVLVLWARTRGLKSLEAYAYFYYCSIMYVITPYRCPTVHIQLTCDFCVWHSLVRHRSSTSAFILFEGLFVAFVYLENRFL